MRALCLGGLAVMAGFGTAQAGIAPPDLCRAAAQTAADQYGIPRQIMAAITEVETRRKVDGVSGPWPWTLNIEGKGYWFETRDEALAGAQAALERGQISVDLGCFQLNYRWHGQAFVGPGAMLDPVVAADYAARFLKDLYAETGDWLAAAGFYHSRTDVHATRYRGMIQTAMTNLGHLPDLPQVALAEPSPPPGPRVGFAIARAHAATVGGTERAAGSLWSRRPAEPRATAGAVGLVTLGGRRGSLFARNTGGNDG